MPNDNQKHNQNNNEQKHVRDDVTKITRHELNYKIWEIGTIKVPPKNLNNVI